MATKAFRVLSMLGVGAALTGSALALTLSIGTAEYRWAGWLALIPLFAVIRLGRPVTALAAGAFWGAAVFGFSAALFRIPFASTLAAAVLLPLAPAAYCFLGAHLTRWIGFSPFVLGVAWMGVEVGLVPLGLQRGLTGPVEATVGLVHAVGYGLGYILVAFVVALTSGIVAGAVLPAGQQQASRRRCDQGAAPHSFHFPANQVFLCSEGTFDASPRAPPRRARRDRARLSRALSSWSATVCR